VAVTTRDAMEPSSPGGNLLTLLPGNPMRSVLLAILVFEVILFGLAIPVMIFVSSVSGGAAAGLGAAGMLLAAAAIALLRRPVGYLLGWATQLAGVALGLATPAMFAVGGMFLLLWLVTFVLGKRLDDGMSAPDKV